MCHANGRGADLETSLNAATAADEAALAAKP
jgi:hypothetical protein